MSNRYTINQLMRLAVIADESAHIAKADKESLKNATRSAYLDIAADALEIMATGAPFADARSIVRASLDAQCLDALYAAIGAGEVVYADMGKLVRKADKLASRLMACAYAIIMGTGDAKINKLEAFAAHMRRGYPLCRVSHMGQAARLADTVEVVKQSAAVDLNTARIADLLAANEMLARELEAARTALQSVIHGGEIVGNMGQKKGKQRARVVA